MYSWEDVEKVLGPEVGNYSHHNTPKWKGYNIPAAFDIEASSWEVGENKYATMYHWQFGVNTHVFVGRRWGEFVEFISRLTNIMHLGTENRLAVYVHNLAYEFQFVQHWLQFEEVFAVKDRKPVRCYCEEGLEFRDSLILTQFSLDKVAKDLIRKYKTVGGEEIAKQVGELDYNLLRHSESPLTPQEQKYCAYDIYILLAYIQEQIEKEGGICNIPMTKTGYVRRRCRNACLQSDQYKKLIRGLKVTLQEYKELKMVFQGGMTHANSNIVGKTMENVRSKDFTSSYPAVMVMERFPMGRAPDAHPKSKQELWDIMQNYCCYFLVEFVNLRSKIPWEHIISESKGVIKGAKVIDNGRVVSAESLTMWVTEQDYYSIHDFYTCDFIRLKSSVRRYYKEYLPTELVSVVLDMYRDKTTLKGVPGKEEDYASSKADLNSCYGMIVTDIINDKIVWTPQDGWDQKTVPTKEEIEKDEADQINKYNRSRNRFLYYPWGVWVTAYARRNLCRGILACGEKYCYADTDSTKYNYPNDQYEFYVAKYNNEVKAKMLAAMKHHGFEEDRWMPKTIKGKVKPLGYWDDDGDNLEFKTLGAKRYFRKFEENGTIKYQVTLAGSNKWKTTQFIMDESGRLGVSPFEIFENGLTIPPDRSGKLGHHYVDAPTGGKLTDYLGNAASWYERSSCALLPIEFTMSMSSEFVDYLMMVNGQMSVDD